MSCTTSQVTVEPGLYEDFKLGDYKTYSFMEVESENPEFFEFERSVVVIKEAFSKELKARGLTESKNNPELKINLGISVEEKNQTRETSLATDPFTYMGQRNYTWKSETVVVNTYKQGTLAVHLIDSKTNKAVWVGITSKVIPPKDAKKQEAVEDAVSEVFAALDSNN